MHVRRILAFWLALAAGSASAQSWFETLTRIDELRDAGDPAAAAELGPELIALAVSDFGAVSDRVAESHRAVSNAQLANRDYSAAAQSLLSAIDIYDELHGATSPQLIEPYLALGDVYSADDQHQLAAGAYFEARDNSRRAYGLYNPEQREIISKMSDAAASSGDMQTALELQRQSLDIAEINFGTASREYYDELFRLSEWLSGHGFYVDAGLYYSRAAAVLRYNLAGDPVEVVRALRLAGRNHRLSTDQLGGPDDLMAALQLVRSMGDQHPLLEAQVLRDIGDWYVGSGDYEQMEEAYFRAWRILEGLENGSAIQQEWFSGTVPVYMAPWQAREVTSDADALRGYVELEFTVDDKGTADRIDVVAADPEGLLDSDARQRINRSRFRPRIEDGRVVEARGSLRLEFGYEARYANN